MALEYCCRIHFSHEKIDNCQITQPIIAQFSFAIYHILSQWLFLIGLWHFFHHILTFFYRALLHVLQMQMNFSTVFFIHLFIYLFIYLSIYLFIYLFNYLLFISSLFFSACQFRVLSQDFQASCDNQINNTGTETWMHLRCISETSHTLSQRCLKEGWYANLWDVSLEID